MLLDVSRLCGLDWMPRLSSDEAGGRVAVSFWVYKSGWLESLLLEKVLVLAGPGVVFICAGFVVSWSMVCARAQSKGSVFRH